MEESRSSGSVAAGAREQGGLRTKTVTGAAVEQTTPAPRLDEHASAVGPGNRIGPFVVERRLGSGGMGSVYLATDPKLERPVAVKVHHDLTTRTFERFEREAKALAKLNHPNIVAVYEVGAHGGRLYIAMEYLDGGTAREWWTPERSWRDVVGLLTQAGRGLAAANAAGLVHRDFKLDNVLVGGDGRVCVADFGVAQLTRTHRADSVEEDPGEELAAPRTLAAGTPGYMAPEQILGSVVGAAADQFAFCVSMYEALYGVRPFVSEDRDELLAEIEHGRPTRPTIQRRIPARIHRAILKGLRYAAEDRHSSLGVLLGRLDVSRTRRRWAAGLSATALVGVGLALGSTASTSAGCDGAADRLAGTWSDAKKADVRAAFAATGLPFGAPLAGRLTERLDAYADQWARMHTEACEATHVQEVQSDEVWDLRMACLNRRRSQLEVVVDELLRVDADTLPRSDRLLAGLAPISDCGELDRLKGAPRPSNDLQTRRAVAELEANLDRARAAHLLGDHEGARRLAHEAQARAHALELPRLEAAASYEVARSLAALDELDAAVNLAYQTAALATKAREPELAAKTWASLVGWVGYDLREPERALAFAQAAQASLAAAPDAVAIEALLESAVASTYLRTRDWSEAERHLLRSLQLQHEAFGEQHDNVALLHNNLGILYNRMGKHSQAREHLAASLEQRVRNLGPDHPRLAASHHNLSNVLAKLGDDELSEVHAARAVAIREAIYPEPHPDLAKSLTTLAIAQGHLGKLDQSLETHQRALALARAIYGDSHEKLALKLTNVAAVHAAVGDHQGAVRNFDAGLDMLRDVSEPDSPRFLHLWIALAASLCELGNATRAGAELDKALAMAERVLADDAPERAAVLLGAAGVYECLPDQGRWHEIAKSAGQLATTVEAPRVRSRGHFILARALTAEGPAGPEALVHARRATEILASMNPVPERAVAEVDAWRAAHR